MTRAGDTPSLPYFKLLRYDEALAAYQRALALSPGDSGTKARIERVKARLGR